MSLYARITAQGSEKIAVHRLGAALREWAGGGITRQQVIDAFVLDVTEQAEIDALAATYQALPVTSVSQGLTKASYLDRMEDVFLLCETGDYTEAKAKSRLGF